MQKHLPFISWSAIFSGMLTGVGLNFLLNLLALVIGLSSFSIHPPDKTLFSLVGFAGFILSAILSMFITGWVAGKLTPPVLQSRAWGILYGFLAWSLLLIFTIILITNFIQYSAFHTNFTSNLVTIKLTNNAPMMTETVAELTKTVPLSLNIETKNKVITLNAFLTFLLFFLGALASCIGGFLGYRKLPVLS